MGGFDGCALGMDEMDGCPDGNLLGFADTEGPRVGFMDGDVDIDGV